MRPSRTAPLELAVLLGAHHVAAQPAVDLYQLELPTSADGTLYLEPTNAPGPGAWHVGAVGSYGYRVVSAQIEERRVGTAVKHRVGLDYLAAVGLGERWLVGLDVPIVAYQRGHDFTGLGLPAPTQTALGDARFVVKSTLLKNGELGGFGLAALGRVSVPTGDGTAYVSDEAPGGELRMLAELRMVALSVSGTLGVHARGERRTLAGHDYGESLRWGGRIEILPSALGLEDSGRSSLSLEARGVTSVAPEFAGSAQSFAVLGLSARYQAGDVGLLLGAEAPIHIGLGTPLVRGVLGVRWAPQVPDQDADGVEDDLDECIDLAEDLDHFEDSDGCPDFDNDDDGVPDEEDRCPAEKEDEDGFEDDDGCVDPDNDGDTIEDARDRCPDQAGKPSPDPRRQGCPVLDTDHDGIPDPADRCVNQAEDDDGFQDDDGCPDIDNDGDGILDTEDDCPLVPGFAASQDHAHGCPSPDRDGDTFDDDLDRCPAEPEDFDGTSDADGCPDEGPSATRLRLEPQDGRTMVVWRREPTFVNINGGPAVDDAGLLDLRALAQVLNAAPGSTALVGVSPRSDSPEDQQLAVEEGFTLVLELRRLTHRDAAAEGVAWQSIPTRPGKNSRVGVVIVPAVTASKPDSSTAPNPP
jgi:hypothetical protein